MTRTSAAFERMRLERYGWDEPLVHAVEEVEAPPPAAQRDDLLIVDVEACGVCHRDLLEREGRFPFLRLPVTPGHEAVGRVRRCGPGVTRFSLGSRVATLHRDCCMACVSCRAGRVSLCQQASWVFGILADGGYASSLVGPESAFYAVPDSMPAPDAAVLHCTFGTVFHDLATLGRLEAGERVLVTGANGGVGAAAVQVAARLGGQVLAVVRDARHVSFARELGASDVLVDPGDSFHKKVADIDLVLDTVGSPTFNSALRTLRVGGRMLSVGNIVAEQARLNLGLVITRGLTLIGGSGATPSDMQALLALHAERPFRIPLHAMLPLAQADRAQRMVRQGGLHGRIVLVPKGGPAC